MFEYHPYPSDILFREGGGNYPIWVHSRRLVPGKSGPLQELAKLISGSPPVPKNTFKKARTTTSTAGDSHTEANVPPSCPQLEH